MKRYLCAVIVVLFVGIGMGRSVADPYLGEVRTVAFNFCPSGHAPLNGQLLSIADNDALFNLIGTTYGGDGQTTFALPVGKPVYSATGEPLLQCIALQGIFPSRP